ncbi:hypothetical protein SAMN04489731_12276 [Amycolatopsis regifaucium]|nr:hypothetical protein SAMN04489731_12276 [Amycolatopsis regifaucium]
MSATIGSVDVAWSERRKDVVSAFIAHARLDLGEPEAARELADLAVRIASKRGRRLPEERARALALLLA